jgi:hypothetical protein
MFEPQEDMPVSTRELLAIRDVERFRGVLEEIRRPKHQGYAIHASEQGLNEMLKQCAENQDLNATMHEKKIEKDPSEPECNIGTDNLWIEAGQVKLFPYHTPIGNFVTDTTTTLKQMWQSENTRRIRARTRACRRLCTISCLRRTPLLHKVSTFLKIA